MAHNPELWKKAKKLCRLNEEDIRIAKEMVFNSKSLIKNIPNPTEGWKAPVKEWLWDINEKHTGKTRPAAKTASHRQRDDIFWDDDVPF